jgi:ATP-binding protein involved in chromosome partitioning
MNAPRWQGRGEPWEQRARRQRLDGIGKLLVVGSGKGGVGKSTVSVNLALALAQRGARVGLLDADAYGPSVPMMLGVRKRERSMGWSVTVPLAQSAKPDSRQMLQPLIRYGIAVMSVGFLMGEEQAIAPMPDVLGLLIRQLLTGVNWGALDYLIVDLPPGTGEPQATLCREHELDGAILVSTPQDIARMDAAKANDMFGAAGVRVLGLVENMSGLICPHCGARVEVFPPSHGGASALDALPVLARIPLDPTTTAGGDEGSPIIIRDPESTSGLAFGELAARVAEATSETGGM